MENNIPIIEPDTGGYWAIYKDKNHNIIQKIWESTMKNSQELLKKANIVPLLNLAQQKEGGGVEGTGPHKVKLLEDKVGKKKDFRTGADIYVVWFIVEEDGIKKRYPVPIKDAQTGEVHYLLQRLGSLKEGTEVVLEYKRKEGSVKGYIDVKVSGEDDSGENRELESGEIPGSDQVEEDGEIDVKDIPF